MSKNNKQTKQSKQSNSVRIIALILAAIMIIGAGAAVIDFVGGMISSNQTTVTTADPHEGHNH